MQDHHAIAIVAAIFLHYGMTQTIEANDKQILASVDLARRVLHQAASAERPGPG